MSILVLTVALAFPAAQDRAAPKAALSRAAHRVPSHTSVRFTSSSQVCCPSDGVGMAVVRAAADAKCNTPTLSMTCAADIAGTGAGGGSVAR